MRRAFATCIVLLFSLSFFAQNPPQHWYDHAVIYEIYPRSFQDTNGDGIGDLNGITMHLGYLKNLGVDAIWISPFFPSPNADFGYDVADYTNVAPEYGTLADWDRLVKVANQLGIRVLVDFVVNHTSDQHPWFLESRSSRTNPKRDWYIWKDGGGPNDPPTHWTSGFGGYTWTWDDKTKQWYYHFFLPQQPDLNWRNPEFQKAMYDVARFWLKHGASGFRLDATPYLFEDPTFPDDPHPPTVGSREVFLQAYNAGLPEVHDALRGLRRTLNEFRGDPVLLAESLTPNISELAKLYGKNHDEIQLPMNFLFADIKKLDAQQFKKQIDAAETQLNGGTPVFLLSNHDRPRPWDTFGDGQNNQQIAKLIAALIMTPRGDAQMYYGDELGMTTIPKSQLDTFGITANRPHPDGRDGERTPMQWHNGPNAGFTTGTPWLPVASNAATVNVATESRDKQSVFSWYKRLLELRHDHPAFRDGAYVPLDSGNSNVLAFGRRAKDGATALVVLNMSGVEQRLDVKGFRQWQKLKRTLLASPATAVPTSSVFDVAPYAIVIAATQ
ncbi:MAG: alpha-amylase family glycosyl hydrolase [Terriglobales bacterium]